MTNKLGPVLDDDGAPIKNNDFVRCLYKILEDGRVVDAAWIEGSVSRIDYDFGHYSYYVNFKFEGKPMRQCFDPADVTFRDRPPKPIQEDGARIITVKEEVLRDKGEIVWKEDEFR